MLKRKASLVLLSSNTLVLIIDFLSSRRQLFFQHSFLELKNEAAGQNLCELGVKKELGVG